MTRRTRTSREAENRLDALESIREHDEPLEIIITDRVVETDWEGPADAKTGDVFRRTRVWRDEGGDWHSERTSLPDDGGGA